MKFILHSLTAITFLSLASCKKSTTELPLDQKLLGEWRYTGTGGGLTGKYTKADSSVTRTLQFKDGLRYLKKADNHIDEEGTYQLSRSKSIYIGTEDNSIVFNGVASSSRIITLRNDTLELADNFYDGYQESYVRMK